MRFHVNLPDGTIQSVIADHADNVPGQLGMVASESIETEAGEMLYAVDEGALIVKPMPPTLEDEVFAEG